MKTRTLLLPALSLFLLPAVASAELYCVSTAAQLASAIESADASASASEIRVRTGSYTFAAAPMQGSYRPHSLRIDGTSDLLLTGGWTGASCDTRSTLNPEQTVLSTGGAGKLMFIEFPAFPTVSTHTVEISGISFRNSTASDLEAACLHVENSIVSAADRGTLNLDRNSFRLCSHPPGAAFRLGIETKGTKDSPQILVFRYPNFASVPISSLALGGEVENVVDRQVHPGQKSLSTS